ncbi:organic anion transporter 3-like [Ostrea edulis]|uniref:organic anion transporter 3-like n=1 Tax=Ostrea edulis TaxID=37623 RepID=UPI0024AE98AC|nr:organic anion transporter 3-like [Ostrea edulis]
MDPSTNVDHILRNLGKFGRFQALQLLLTFVTIWSAAFSLMSSVFTGYKPEFKCSPLGNESSSIVTANVSEKLMVVYKECTIHLFQNSTNSTEQGKELPCPSGYQYIVPKDTSFVTEFDLVCGDDSLAEVSQMLTMAGMGLGAVLSSIISDRYGRKVVQVGAHIAIFLAGFGVAFAPNYTVLIVFRFISGALQQALAMVGAVLAMEWVPQECRFLCEVFGLLFWTTGVVLVTPIAYLMRDNTWRDFQLVLTLCSSYSLIQYWIQEESIRWLFINGKTDQAERILRKAAKWNKVNFDDVISNTEEEYKLTKTDIETASKTFTSYGKDGRNRAGARNENLNKENDFKVEHYTILTIFRSKSVLKNSIIMWFTWLTNSLTYFALTLTSTTLAGNRFLNYFFSGAVEYIACFLEYIMMKRIGRRSIIVIFNAASALALLTGTLLHYFADGESVMITASVVFTLVGKAAITGSFSTIFLYTPELYPTNLRNVGIGVSSAFARVGGMLSPFAGTLAKHVSWAPGAIFACMCFIVTISVFSLPETRGVELPSTMNELKMWYKIQSKRKIRKQDT